MGALSILFARIGNRASIILALSLPLCAYLPSDVSNVLLPYMTFIIIGLISVAMIRVDLTRVIGHLKSPVSLLIALAILMLAFPLGVHWIARYFSLSGPVHIALVLMACAPPLGSAPNLAYLLKLDGELVFNITLAGTVIIPLTAPWVIGITLGSQMSFDQWTLFQKLLITVGSSFLIAMIVRKILGRERIKRNSAQLDGISTVIMVLFVATAMAGVSETIENEPLYMLLLLAIAFASNFGTQFLFSIIGLFVQRIVRLSNSAEDMKAESVLSFAMVAGNRNLGLVAAVIPIAVLQEILPFLALYQVPIYLTPLVGGVLYGYLLRRK
jgi:arsenite transporter